ncbi:MAG: hypothetical protein LC799_08995 [Actinobacteria bacterium]|nr:hypothetical protein [Actinomycetota bacterium]
MLYSRQPQRLGLLDLLLALSLMHMSPAQAGETRSETAVRGVEQAVQGPLGIAPLSLAVVLAPSPVEPPTVEPPSVPKPPPPAAEAQGNHDDGDDDSGDGGHDDSSDSGDDDSGDGDAAATHACPAIGAGCGHGAVGSVESPVLRL